MKSDIIRSPTWPLYSLWTIDIPRFFFSTENTVSAMTKRVTDYHVYSYGIRYYDLEMKEEKRRRHR